jgi:hypothetical protein
VNEAVSCDGGDARTYTGGGGAEHQHRRRCIEGEDAAEDMRGLARAAGGCEGCGAVELGDLCCERRTEAHAQERADPKCHDLESSAVEDCASDYGVYA